jgi:hypothetical protein
VTPSSASQFYLQLRTFGNVVQAMNYYEKRMFLPQAFCKTNIKKSIGVPCNIQVGFTLS